jgi:hypothetical protein
MNPEKVRHTEEDVNDRESPRLHVGGMVTFNLTSQRYVTGSPRLYAGGRFTSHPNATHRLKVALPPA